jgi:ornithine carbamoyltransferase
MTTPTRVHSLLKETDLDREQFLDLVAQARALRAAKREGREERRLTGQNIALIFQKNSTRTRSSFEIAAYDQGAHVTYLGPEGSHLGREESIADTAHVLGVLYDGIEFRGFGQDTIEEFAANAGVPVWNGLSDQWHPTQMLADVLTMTDYPGGRAGPAAAVADVEAISYCFLGDGRGNIARSLLVTGALLGMDVRIGAPRELWPPDDVRALARELAGHSGARITVTDNVAEAVDGAGFIYTDVWVSMGEADSVWATRVPLLTPYRVTAEVMAATHRADARFMHCLPAVHDTTTELGARVHQQFGLAGAEVTDAVFRSPGSVVFTQAENRMHTIKALLVSALGR